MLLKIMALLWSLFSVTENVNFYVKSLIILNSTLNLTWFIKKNSKY